jgi:uncharacterized membrane protein YphA (DoxX/SURF4 family)
MKRGLLFWLMLAGRLGIAGIFLYAGIAKVREPWLQFAVSIESFKIVPDTWLEPIARIFPWCEIALAIALVPGILARWFSLILTGMLAWFLFIGIRAYAKGLAVDCGCFGSGGGAIDAKWFVEHAAMLALGLAVTTGEFLKARSRRQGSSFGEASRAIDPTPV